MSDLKFTVNRGDGTVDVYHGFTHKVGVDTPYVALVRFEDSVETYGVEDSKLAREEFLRYLKDLHEFDANIFLGFFSKKEYEGLDYGWPDLES